MSRQEFSRKTKAQAFERANGCCESCSAKLKVGEVEYDHVLPCALGGDNTLENCACLCKICHNAKTGKDVGMIRKADRQRDYLSGAKKSLGKPIPGSKRSGWKKRLDGTVERR